MPDDTTTSAPSVRETGSSDRREAGVWWATWVALLLVLVGLVDGIIMGMKRKVAACPDGTLFPEGTTDFECYVHPQAGIGVAIAAISVVLGVLVVFTSILVRASLADRP